MSRPYDLIVIGGGINGAAVAREAALLGLGVLLLEREDLCSGTSAASTRLIHGGLRYLEHAELGLVRESLAERERLFHDAPQLVTPLEFDLPIYARGKRPKWQIRAGMLLYDILSMSKSTPRHRMLSRAETLARLPGLSPSGLLGAASYFDGQVTFAERLVIENMHDAVSHGADLMSYTEAREILIDEGRVTGVRWRAANGETGTAQASRIVNAAGPWVDRVNAGASQKRLIGGTRGSHLIVEPFPGAPQAAVYTEAVSDGRPFFVIPWNGLYLIGTTDERFDGDPGEVAASEAEIDYLVKETETVFPAAKGLADSVLYTCAGVRPLPYTTRGAEGAITRRHLIRRHREARGLLSVVGGKLTTHRALAEDVMRKLRRRDASIPAGSKTRARMLPGALSAGDELELLEQLSEHLGRVAAERLLRVYGAHAERLLRSVRESPELGQLVARGSLLLAVELVHAIEREWAVHLTDILLRRSVIGLSADFGTSIAAPAADRLVELGIWSRERAEAEVAAYLEEARRHRVRALARGSRA